MPATVRPATPADLECILGIASQCPSAPHWRAADYRPYLECLSEGLPLHHAEVALAGASGQEMAGFAAATLLIDGEENRCELESIAVCPSARRQGVAIALLKAILTWAAAHDAHRLGMEVRAGNEAALALYRHFGFGVEGRRRGYYSDPAEDALLLGRPITRVSDISSFSTGNDVEDRLPRC